MEGVITCAVAILAWVLLVDFPDGKHKSWRFLNENEIKYVIARINADRGDAEEKEKFKLGRFLAHGLDVKVWGFAFIFCMILVVSYSFAYFLPLILQRGMGFSVAAAQCLVAPPYFAAGCWMSFQGWLGDKYRMKAPIMLFNCVIAFIGLPVMTYASSNGVRYLYVSDHFRFGVF